MARCAESALLAAIEVYNKPLVAYREQTLALLLVNAWELLLKARVLQLNDNRLPSIYRRQRGSRRYQRTRSGDPQTISIWEAFAKTSVDRAVHSNLDGLNRIRNQAAHRGTLTAPLKRGVLAFGTAAVQNFVGYAATWFGLAVRVPYLLPVGFVGSAVATGGPASRSQRQLLEQLARLATSGGDVDSPYKVAIDVEIALNPKFSGGGRIGVTKDASAPKLRLSDDEALDHYGADYEQVVAACRERYVCFKRNKQFNAVMREVKDDPLCAHNRMLDPRNRGQGDGSTTSRLSWIGWTTPIEQQTEPEDRDRRD